MTDISTDGSDPYKADRETISGIRQRLERYREACRPVHLAMVRNHRLYTADPRINDPRDPVKERHRSWVTVPKIHSNVNTASAIEADIILSMDPMVKAMRVHDAKQEIAQYAENVVDYWMQGNRFRSRVLPELTRNLEIQGTVIVKCDWVDHSRVGSLVTTQEDKEAWWAQVLQVGQLIGMPPDLQADPAAFKVWKQQAEMAGHPLPDFPKPTGMQLIKGYKGPWYSLPQIWDVFFDPFQSEIQSQEAIIEIVVQPREWLDQRMAAEAATGNHTIDPAAVAYARQHGISSTQEKFNEFKQAYYRYLNLDPGQSPLLKSSDEPQDVFYEVSMPNGTTDKYFSILNECAIVNTNRQASPYPFGDANYLLIKCIPMTGSAFGMSPIQVCERLVYEASAIRSKRMDITNMAATPAFTVLKSAYNDLPKNMRTLNVGAFYPVNVHDALKQIEIKVPPALFQENFETANDIDEAWGIGANLRGAQATVGRVPATESQARQTQATLPLIARARNIEDAFASSFPWCFMMLREYCDEEELLGIGGGGGGELLKIDKAKLMEAIGMTLRFQGATTTRNRDQQATMLNNWTHSYANVVQPHELRKVAALAAKLMGIVGVDEIFDQAVTDAMQQQADGQLQAMQMGVMPPGMGGGMPQTGAGGAGPAMPGGAPSGGGGGAAPPQGAGGGAPAMPS